MRQAANDRTPPPIENDKDYDRLWQEYGVANGLAMHQHTRWRDVMGIYLTANSLLGVGLATVVSRPLANGSYTARSNVVLAGICLLGVLISFLWLTSMMRIRRDIDAKNTTARWLEWRLWKYETGAYWIANSYVRHQKDVDFPEWRDVSDKDYRLEFPKGAFTKWMSRKGPNVMETFVPVAFFFSYALFLLHFTGILGRVLTFVNRALCQS
jgi:hypothetical protein